jgi:hypothetical protein
MAVSLSEKGYFFSFKETILGQTFAIRSLVAQSVGNGVLRLLVFLLY